VFFINTPMEMTLGGISQVRLVLRGAKAMFAHDDNAYDFLVPLNVASQRIALSSARLSSLLVTKRGFSMFDAAPLTSFAYDGFERAQSQRQFIEQQNNLVITL
jgi:hypothetical protein